MGFPFPSHSQETDQQELRQYYPNFPFQEGIYKSFYEFKKNQPSIQLAIQGRGNDLKVWNDSLQKMVAVAAEKVWGYSQSGNIYIAVDDAFWRIIKIGSLAQFSAIIVSRFTTVDPFGFPVENYSKTMKSMFLDMKEGNVYELNADNLALFLENEPMLYERFKKKRRKKEKELILMLNAYNELNPVYFPVYE